MNKSKKCYIALLDLLGFSNFVKNETPCIVENILSDFMNSSVPGSEALDYNIFSDTIVISITIETDLNVLEHPLIMQSKLGLLLMVVSHIQKFNIINNGGLPVRGGITMGDFFLNKEKNIMFGKGLVVAHEFEAELAVYPRIYSPHLKSIPTRDILSPWHTTQDTDYG